MPLARNRTDCRIVYSSIEYTNWVCGELAAMLYTPLQTNAATAARPTIITAHRVAKIFFIFNAMATAACTKAPSDVERGRRLAEQYQCGTCHVIPGVNGAHGIVAVTLESVGQRSYIAGRIPNTREHLVRWIVEPAALVPGTLMPSMGVTPDDARDIAAYLGQLR